MEENPGVVFFFSFGYISLEFLSASLEEDMLKTEKKVFLWSISFSSYILFETTQTELLKGEAAVQTLVIIDNSSESCGDLRDVLLDEDLYRGYP